ncbi:pentapeptide repeat-containing protein [Planosporangium sp. 12N6]|uniref:pentapeptide repeat-containing protein n=1 Tax=Planosporangium spinosum TaxID=3402278 RepID=UPI003CE906CB
MVVLAAASSLVLTAVVVGPLAWWVGGDTVGALHGKERADAINAVRQTLLTAATGLAALTALLFTGRSFYLNRRGQLTDRYAKAVSLLASTQATERIGGVYALEHLMKESPGDHDTVVQVLAAFVRERRPVSDRDPVPVSVPDPGPARPGTERETGTAGHGDRTEAQRRTGVRCPADVQAALTVIGRRPQRPERPIDLSYTDLAGADLTGARLTGAAFQGSVLAHGCLVGAELAEADFTDAVLTRALLTRAVLRRAVMVRADLRNAILAGVNLALASLMEADLRFAGLPHADLPGAHLLRTRLGAADLRHADLTGADLSGVEVRALTRAELENVLWRQLDTNGQVLGELFDTLGDTDPDHANLWGLRVSTDDRHRFPALPAAPPLGPERPGYVIGHADEA